MDPSAVIILKRVKICTLCHYPFRGSTSDIGFVDIRCCVCQNKSSSCGTLPAGHQVLQGNPQGKNKDGTQPKMESNGKTQKKQAAADIIQSLLDDLKKNKLFQKMKMMCE